MDGPKDLWSRVLSLPRRFVGDPAPLARDNIFQYIRIQYLQLQKFYLVTSQILSTEHWSEIDNFGSRFLRKASSSAIFVSITIHQSFVLGHPNMLGTTCK